MDQKPSIVSIGRIVHYRPFRIKDENGIPLYHTDVLAAIISCLYDSSEELDNSNKVDLHIFTENGLEVRKGIEKGDGINQWNWPPKF